MPLFASEQPSTSGSTPFTGSVKETKATVAVVSNTATCDLATGSAFDITVTGNTTIAFTNIPPAGIVVAGLLIITNGGSATVTWPSGSKYKGGVAPTLVAAGKDRIGFLIHDGGATKEFSVQNADVK